MRKASREAASQGDRRRGARARRRKRRGRSSSGATQVTSPFYERRRETASTSALKITAIRCQRLRLPLEPPFYAAWDPVPRRAFEATIVRVETDAGLVGIGSGDTMVGFEEFEHLFIGRDPLAIARHARTLETISFHAGRYWPLEAALWDLAGASLRVLRSRRCSAARPTASRRMRRWGSLRVARGAGARTPSRSWSRDSARSRSGSRAERHRRGHRVVGGVRDAVGDATRDHRRPQPVVADAGRHRARARSRRCAPRRSSGCATTACCGSRSRSTAATGRGCGTLRAADGGADRRGRDGAHVRRAAAGARGTTRSTSSSRTSCSRSGSRASRTLAELALRRNRWFTPHTWTNGIGLLANLHVCAGVGGGPFLEFPYDPPGWTPERRDFMLADAGADRRRRLLVVPVAPRPRDRARRGGGRALQRRSE